MQINANQLRIRTPEGVPFSLPLADPASRMLAWFVDVLIILLFLRLLITMVSALGMISPDLAISIFFIGYFVLSTGYAMILEWFWNGQTIGKRLLRLRVMDVQGLQLTVSQIMIRNLLRQIDILPVAYLVGGVASLVTRHYQRLGDVAANTVVIRETPIPPPDLTEIKSDNRYNSFNNHLVLQARLRQRVSPDAATIALQAIIRRNQLDEPARIQLFANLATYFQSLVEFPDTVTRGISDEQYIRNVIDTVYASANTSKSARQSG